MDFNDDMRRKYQAVSTATLTSVLLKRGFRNTFIGGIKLVNPNAPRMVGPAYTLRYIPAREDLDQPSAFDGRKHRRRKTRPISISMVATQNRGDENPAEVTEEAQPGQTSEAAALPTTSPPTDAAVSPAQT